jgi:hypothetical protein
MNSGENVLVSTVCCRLPYHTTGAWFKNITLKISRTQYAIV